jgi:hypothetical protein
MEPLSRLGILFFESLWNQESKVSETIGWECHPPDSKANFWPVIRAKNVLSTFWVQ